MITTRPILKRHQLRQGEDLSKIFLDESGSFEPGAVTSDDDMGRNEPLLANSVELQKLQNEQKLMTEQNGTDNV
jgi:hypothetical protein